MASKVIESLEALSALQGKVLGVSDWIEVSQLRIGGFAEVTGDEQWIHVDPERAGRESPYRTTIAHGFLTLSLISLMRTQAVNWEACFGRLINYGLNRVRFPAPVPAGAKIRGRFRLMEVSDITGGVQLVLEVTIEREGGEKPCLVAEWILRGYR